MPYSREWIPNQLFLEHNGVRIFHTYKCDEGEPRRFSFGTASDTTDEYDDTNFRVFDLPTWTSADKTGDDAQVESAIISAIDGGHLQAYIEAAKGRPKIVSDDEGTDEDASTELESCSADEMKLLVLKLEALLLIRITSMYKLVGGEMNVLVSFGSYSIDYMDGTEYTITGLILRQEDDGKALMIVQDEECGPKDIEQHIEFIEITILVDILYELERIAKC